MPTCENENCDKDAKFLDLIMDSRICETCRDEQIKGGQNPEIFTAIESKPENKKMEFENGSVEFSVEDSRLKSSGNVDLDSEQEPTPEDPAKIEVLPPESDLTVFEETLTEEGLKIIEKQADNLPAIAKTNEQYEQVYDFCTRLKRVSKAARKKEKTLQKELKSHFNLAKSKIATDLSFVIDIITPIIDKTIESRDYLECWKIAIKENKARDLAIKQQLEFERQEAIRIYSEKWDSAHEENRLVDEKLEQAKEKERLRLEKEKLEKERVEFEYQKQKELNLINYGEAFELVKPDGSKELIAPERIKIIVGRLGFDDAWEEAHRKEFIDDFVYCKAASEEVKISGYKVNIDEEDTAKDIEEKIDKAVADDNTDSIDIVIDDSDKTVPEVSSEIDDFQQIMTEKVDEPEKMTDREKLEQIKLSAGIFSGEVEKHLAEGFRKKSNETYIHNFFLSLTNFVDEFPETDI